MLLRLRRLVNTTTRSSGPMHNDLTRLTLGLVRDTFLIWKLRCHGIDCPSAWPSALGPSPLFLQIRPLRNRCSGWTLRWRSYSVAVRLSAVTCTQQLCPSANRYARTTIVEEHIKASSEYWKGSHTTPATRIGTLCAVAYLPHAFSAGPNATTVSRRARGDS